MSRWLKINLRFLKGLKKHNGEFFDRHFLLLYSNLHKMAKYNQKLLPPPTHISFFSFFQDDAFKSLDWPEIWHGQPPNGSYRCGKRQRNWGISLTYRPAHSGVQQKQTRYVNFFQRFLPLIMCVVEHMKQRQL